jgi:hypothetical protein
MIELEEMHDTRVMCFIKGCHNQATHYCTSRAFGETAIFAIPSVSSSEIAKRYPPIVPRVVSLPSREDQGTVVMSQYVLVGQVHYSGAHYTMSRYCNGKLMLFDDMRVSDVPRGSDILDVTPVTMLMYEIDARPIISSNALRILRFASEIQAQRTSRAPISKQISDDIHDDRAIMEQRKQQEAADLAMAQRLHDEEQRARQPSMYGTPAAIAVPYVQPSSRAPTATTVSYVPPPAPSSSVFSRIRSNPKYDV